MDERIVEVAKFEIAKLQLQKNDILVFRYTESLPLPEELECLVDSIYSILPKDITCLILGRKDLELAVIHKEDEEETLD